MHTSNLRQAYPLPAFSPIVPCLVLTLSGDKGSVVRVGSINCKVVTATPFHTDQLQHVRADVRLQLESNNLKRYRSYVMSNNNTVNIFENHAMLWREVVRSNKTTLILEDDAQLYANAGLEPLLEYIRTQDVVNNFVLKLQNTIMHSFYKWSTTRLGNTTMYQCTCIPPVVNYGMLAYFIDPVAAQTLLRLYLPIWTHVDTWIHHVGCRKHFHLFSLPQSIFYESGRPSLHRSVAEKPTAIEKIVHLTQDALSSNCTDG